MDHSFNAHEARVFGVLVEKAFSTPDQYPLSLTAATAGANQKSNRDPVVDVSEPEMRIALQGLRMKGFVGVSQPAGSRVEKYRHNGKEMLKIGDRPLAVLAELLLRGPQTTGELRSRAKRMRDVTGDGVLEEALGALQDAGLAKALPGGRATRYQQLLCAERALDPEGSDGPARAPARASATATPVAPTAAAGLAERVETLEQRVRDLEAEVQRLTEALGG